MNYLIDSEILLL